MAVASPNITEQTHQNAFCQFFNINRETEPTDDRPPPPAIFSGLYKPPILNPRSLGACLSSRTITGGSFIFRIRFKELLKLLFQIRKMFFKQLGRFAF